MTGNTPPSSSPPAQSPPPAASSPNQGVAPPTSPAASPTATTTVEPVKRVGISDATLVALGIRNVEADEAEKLTGFNKGPGIYIPFHGVTDRGAKPNSVEPYGRLRIKGAVDGQKYHQRAGTRTHNYIQKGITLVNGDLLLVEGEFKSISLTEAGFPAIGLSGFYSWSLKWEDHTKPREIEPDLAATIARLCPSRLVFFGDADTATNSSFWQAMPQLATWTNLPVALPRIEYSAPNGKGVDDIRGKLSAADFETWIRDAILKAVVVQPRTSKEDLMTRLLDREHESIRKLTGDEREKAKERLIKSGAYLKSTVLDSLGKFAEETLGMNPTSLKKDAREHARKKDAEKNGRNPKANSAAAGGNRGGSVTDPDEESPRMTGVTDVDVLNRFFMIGKEYYGYSMNPATGKMSKSASICDKSFVCQSLIAAGYTKYFYSSPATPVCGCEPNLTEISAALLYLHKTRFVGMVERLYRPYGPMVQDDGTRVFNNSQVAVCQPVATVIDDLFAKEIQFTYRWLSNLLPGDQLDHFLSLLSYVYCAALEGNPKKTRAVFLVGNPSSGKSLLIDYFVPTVFGQRSAADAHRLLKGELGASAVLQSYVCKLSDADLGGTRDIKRVQQGVHALLADHTTSGRLMYQNVTTEEVINLFMFSTNPDGSTMNFLRDLPNSIRDKFAIYHCGDGIDAVRNPQENDEDKLATPEPTIPADVTPLLKAEMPFFCSLLKNWRSLGWNAKYFGDDRFGVKPYSSTSLATIMIPADDDEIVIEILRGKKFHRQYALTIYNTLIESGIQTRLVSSIRPSDFKRILLNLCQTHPSLVQVAETPNKTGFGTKNRWFTVTGDKFVLEEQNTEREHLQSLASNVEFEEKQLRIAEHNRRSDDLSIEAVEAQVAAMKKAEIAEEAQIEADFAAISKSAAGPQTVSTATP